MILGRYLPGGSDFMTFPFGAAYLGAAALARRLLRAEGGGVAIIFGLAMLPVMGLVGAGVDYTRASALRTDLQRAADAAALAGAGQLAAPLPGGLSAKATAEHVLEGMIGAIQNPPQVTVNDTARTVTVVASATLSTAVMRILRVTEIPLQAEAAARVLPPSGPPVCFQALEPTSTALIASGSGKIDAAPCITWINSSSPSSVIMSGTTSVTGLRNCVVAGSPARFTPAAERCAARPDPYAGTTPAAPAGLPSCSTTIFSGSAPVRLSPCVAPTGFTFSGTGSVTFDPGVYVLRGPLIVSGMNMSLTATGVTFVLENGASVTLSGVNVTYHLTASTTGNFAGFVFYQRPSTNPGDFIVSGTNSFYFEGALYIPGADVTMSGTNTATITSPFTAVIAKSYILSGTNTWKMNYDPPRMTVPVPSGLRTGSGSIALVR
jgi:Flp pilus assembly protein TadG